MVQARHLRLVKEWKQKLNSELFIQLEMFNLNVSRNNSVLFISFEDISFLELNNLFKTTIGATVIDTRSIATFKTNGFTFFRISKAINEYSLNYTCKSNLLSLKNNVVNEIKSNKDFAIIIIVQKLPINYQDFIQQYFPYKEFIISEVALNLKSILEFKINKRKLIC